MEFLDSDSIMWSLLFPLGKGTCLFSVLLNCVDKPRMGHRRVVGIIQVEKPRHQWQQRRLHHFGDMWPLRNYTRGSLGCSVWSTIYLRIHPAQIAEDRVFKGRHVVFTVSSIPKRGDTLEYHVLKRTNVSDTIFSIWTSLCPMVLWTSVTLRPLRQLFGPILASFIFFSCSSALCSQEYTWDS